MGKLIVLESCDGAGKSTQIKQIVSYLKEEGLKYDYLHFPMYGHNEFSEIIAKFLRGEFGNINKVNPYFVANIYAMDRYLYLPKLTKKLEENDVVLLDRYVFSNIAYQAAKYTKENAEKAYKISDWIYKLEFEFLKLPYPDLTLFLDIPIKTIEKRLYDARKGKDRDYLKGKQDIHEADLEFQSRVRDNYLILKLQEPEDEMDDYIIVPCSKTENSVTRILTPEELFISYKEHIKNIII